MNCNLQRLDGPVRGNGKIIQELEAIFRGAGWNVIKVIWGAALGRAAGPRRRRRAGRQDERRPSTASYQRYAVEDGAYIREHFFGPDPRLRDLVEHLSDDDIRSLPRGGHDYRKLYAAYKAATEQTGAPTVILAKTVKGWTLGPGVEGRNATHQIKKMTVDAAEGPPATACTSTTRSPRTLSTPTTRRTTGRPRTPPEYRYLMERRRALDGVAAPPRGPGPPAR